MKKLIQLLALSLIGYSSHAGYIPLTIASGFNADVIADGIGAVNTRITHSVDDGPFAFVALGWKLTATSTPLSYGLPVNRTVTNGSVVYNLAAYDAPNALRIDANNTNSQVNFQAPYSFGSKLYMLATGGSGSATVSVTVRFSDNTTQVQTGILIGDWFNGNPYALGGIGRIGTGSNIPENQTGGPRLYQYEININAANQAKSIVGVTVNRTAGAGIVNIFGFNLKESSIYTPFTISSGLNADVITDGTGTSISRTTNDVDGVSYVFVAQGWQFSASNTPTTTGLPTNGIINSNIDAGLTYQLAPYTQNNSLRLAANNAPSVLTFAAPQSAENLYVLNTTGSGTANMTVTVTFSDNSTQVFSNLATSDWYGATPFEIGGIGRVLRNATATTVETAPNGPRMYRSVLALSPTNYNKLITSITVNRNSASGNDTKLNIFAVTGEKKLSLTCDAPTLVNTPNITPTTASVSWSSNASATQWQLIYGPTGFNPATQGTRTIVSSTPQILNNLSAVTTYDVYVRSICTNGDTSTRSAIHTFTTACIPPVITSTKDSFVCASGAVTLEAQTTNAVLRWYNVATGGTPIFTGHVFQTPIINTTSTYYVSAYGNNCESSRIAVVASVRPNPVVNLGIDTAICQGTNITLSANQNAVNRTYEWSNNTSNATLVVNQAGTYAVKVTEQKCSSRDTIVITAGIEPVATLVDSTGLCLGNTLVLNAGNPGSNYLWNTGATSSTLVVTTGGLYSVIVTSVDKCKLYDTTFVSNRALPIKPFHNRTFSKCAIDPIVLNALNSGHDFIWNTNETTQSITAVNAGDYTVKITNQYGCITHDTAHIAFLPVPLSNGFSYIPEFYNNLGKVTFSIINPTDVVSVRWDFGDGTHSSLFSPVHTYDSLKSYNVRLTLFNKCDSTNYDQTIHIGSSTSTDNIDKNTVSIYPNPAFNELYVSLLQDKNSLENIVIYNSVGQQVYTSEKFTNRLDKTVIDISSLKTGYYTIVLHTKEGSYPHTFIKQ